MPRSVKCAKRRKHGYQYNRNRKRAWKKTKALPRLSCKQVKAAWNPKKTVNANMADMGLVYNLERAFPMPSVEDLLKPPDVHKDTMEDEKPLPPQKAHVAQELEDKANTRYPRAVELPNTTVKYVTYLMDKYGDDYKAMAKDPKNYYQDTPKQIKKKINKFKNIPSQYNRYLESKKVMDVS